jgi:6,7-dimethyl-8-ribityllumazine synthase
MSHICILVARFYPDIADELVRGATAALTSAGVTYDIVEVPGAFELSATMHMAIESRKFDGYVALGCVIRGETSHYDHVCKEMAYGLNQFASVRLAPLGFGVLTVENMDQAIARASTQNGNKGKDAANTCLHMLALKQSMLANA